MRLLLLIPCLILMSCASASVNVYPGGDGTHKVVARDVKKESAEKAAYTGAQEFCQDLNKPTVFVTNKAEYQGKLDEGTRNAIRSSSQVAMVAGAVGAMNEQTRETATAAGTAGVVAFMVTNDKDYMAEALFRCENIGEREQEEKEKKEEEKRGQWPYW